MENLESLPIQHFVDGVFNLTRFEDYHRAISFTDLRDCTIANDILSSEKCSLHPLITPIGRVLATIREMPALCVTPTTEVTSL